MGLTLKRILNAVFGQDFANMHRRVFMGRWVVLKVFDIAVVVDKLHLLAAEAEGRALTLIHVILEVIVV